MTGPGELLRRHGLTPRKQWGQNFLHAPHVIEAILGAVGTPEVAVEIGAGLGAITAPLLDRLGQLHAIERDRDLCRALRAELGDRANLTLHEADAVRFDYGSIPGSGSGPGTDRPTVVGNLPYHLTGPLLFALLAHDQATVPWIIMVQREVADRLRADPGNRTYGGISVLMQRVRDVSSVCAVPRGSFLPPPRVDSMVVRLDPLPEPRGQVGDPEGLRQLVRAAFQRRRKTLSNALGSLADRDTVLSWCATADVDPRVRPETLGPEAFAALQRAREAGHA